MTLVTAKRRSPHARRSPRRGALGRVSALAGLAAGGAGGAVEARYWRLNHFASAGRARAAECLFLDELGAKLPATASASSYRYLNIASRAYEEQPYSTETGDSNRYWQAATGDNVNAWFAIDLGEGNDARVHGIYIWTTDPYAPVSGFTELEYSHDGVNWASLGTITHDIVWGGIVEGTIDVSNLTQALP